MPTTEAIDRLYLELSQFTNAKTAREIELEGLIKQAWDYTRRVRSGVVLSEKLDLDGARLMADMLSAIKAGER